MTAILGMVYRDVPCLLGDIMISSPNQPNYEITLPVSGVDSANTPIRWNTHFFTDWRQKLIQIGPHMMVAWAGTRIEAVAAIGHLRKSYAKADTTKLEELTKIIESLVSFEFKDLDLIALISNHEGWKLISHGAGVKRFETPWGGNACAAGTGEDALIDALEVKAREHNNSDSFYQALSSLISTSARMWSFDIFGIGPELAFGGAYELAIKVNTEIEKINNILYVTHEYTPGVGLGLLPLFKKVNYYNDYLIVQILDCTRPYTGTHPRLEAGLTVKRGQLYVVPPVDKSWSTTSPHPTIEEIFSNIPDFNPSHFATYVRVESVTPGKGFYITLHHLNTEERPIVFNYEANYEPRKLPISFILNGFYRKQIEDQVKIVLQEADEPCPPQWKENTF